MLRFINFLANLFDGLFMPPLVPVFSGWQREERWSKGDWFNNHTGFAKRPSVHRRRSASPHFSSNTVAPTAPEVEEEDGEELSEDPEPLL